jgi:hypothetical protein
MQFILLLFRVQEIMAQHVQWLQRMGPAEKLIFFMRCDKVTLIDLKLSTR